LELFIGSFVSSSTLMLIIPINNKTKVPKNSGIHSNTFILLKYKVDSSKTKELEFLPTLT